MSRLPKNSAAKKPLPLVIEKDEDGMYVVECSVLSGCYTQGATYDEAMKNIKEVISLALEDKDNKAIYDDYTPTQISFQTISI